MAIVVYGAVSVLRLDHGESLTGAVAGTGGDPFLFIWFFAWWPWAVLHHADLLHTGLVWQPLGAPLLWLTSTPLPALVFAPVTLLWGPVASYNLCVLVAPVLSAFTAYLLFGAITPRFLPALLGGWLFGFSGYEMATDFATPNLSVTALLPCLVLLALHRLRGRIDRRWGVLLGATIMVGQFLISIEVFATTWFFGFLTWVAAVCTLPSQRDRLKQIFVDAVLVAAVTAVVLSPLLLSMLFNAGYLSLPAKWVYVFSGNLLNFFVPSPVTIGGGISRPINQWFHGGVEEADAYLGLPLILLLVLFARSSRRLPGGIFLIVTLGVFLVASLGPRLWVGGLYTPLVLPWWVVLHLPLIASALPGRFALFVALAAAAAAVLWMAHEGPGAARPARLGLGVLSCLALLPAPHPWVPLSHTAFFQPGRVQAALGPAPRLLVLPFGTRGPSTLWQVQSGFGYAQSGGYLGYPPRAMQHYNVVEQLFDDFELPSFGADLTAFVQGTGTQYVVAGPGVSPGLAAALAALHWPTRRIDDVTVLTVPAVGR